jgi:tripartite-type tricarboxylate transporter receptor subunit TctC
LYSNLSFNYVRDLTPVAAICTTAFVMVVNPSLPVNSVGEFIAYAKARPGSLNMASSGIGTAPHLFGELFKMMTGVDMVHVPYRGNSLPDLLAGQVQVTFTGVGSAIEYIRTGKLRALGVTTATRLDVLPQLPTINEAVPGYEASGWNGILAPKGTSPEIVSRLHQEVNGLLADAGIRDKLVTLGVFPIPMAASDFGALIAKETEKWAKVVQFAKIKL